jgi:predicted Zn-ribbon and HTH transcriptional regulator
VAKDKITVVIDQANQQPAAQVVDTLKKQDESPQANQVVWICRTRHCGFMHKKYFRLTEPVFYSPAKCPKCQNTIEAQINWFRG